MLRTARYNAGPVRALSRPRPLEPTDSSITHRATLVGEANNVLGAALSRYRAYKREIDADRDYSVKEREQALTKAREAYLKEITAAAEVAQQKAGAVEQEIAQVLARHSEPDAVDVDRSWARLKPLLDGGVAFDPDVLDDHVRTRADVAALRREYPAYMAAKAGRKAAEPAFKRQTELALGMLDLHEDGLVEPELRDARVARRRLDAVADSIAHTTALAGREMERSVSPQDMIASGLEAEFARTSGSRLPEPEIEAIVAEGASSLSRIKAGLGDGPREA